MSYEKLYLKILNAFSNKNIKTNDFKNESLENDEPLGRFIVYSKWISNFDQTIKYHAFLPATDLNLSVYRTKNLDEESIWRLAQDNVISAMREMRTLYGRAEIIPFDVYSNKLEIDPNNIPKRHANITNWPKDKHEKLIIAKELARKALLKLK